MKTFLALFSSIFLLSPAAAFAQVRWSPQSPTPSSRVTITVLGCSQPGKLHWGVNGWKQPIQSYWPEGTVPWGDGAAVESPLAGPDSTGACHITLGPFDDPSQPVDVVDFVLHWADDSWDNNNGNDYHIRIVTGVSWEPLTPDVNDTITIRVTDATQGGYLHWGVNPGDRPWTTPIQLYWPEGTFLWTDGIAVETPLLGPSPAGVCSVRVGPFASGQQPVRAVDFVIHWADDTWDNNQGQDYHIPVALQPADGSITVQVLAPAQDSVVSGEVEIRATAAGNDLIELWIDGAQRTVATGTELSWTWSTEGAGYGKHSIVAVAKKFGARQRVAMDVVSVWVLPDFQIADPPEGTVQGATDNGDGTVTFAFFAPGKRFVTLIGDFNNWDGNADVMNRSVDGLWWIVKTLSPGTYRYQYLVDGSQRLADPYARDVDWTYQGREDWRPENARAVLKVGAEPYQWHDAGFRRPSWYSYVIYELHVGDFAGTFAGVTARLDYLKNLGINAIELMPCYEFPGGESWGYNPAFYFAPESAYGTPEDLKRLVDEAHKRGIAVFMDMVFNHVDATSPLAQLYLDNLDASPYFHSSGNPWGFPDFDHTKPATQRLFRDVVQFWIKEYHIDGYRYDALRFISQEGIRSFSSTVERLDPVFYQIAEYLPQDPALVRDTPIDAEWHDTFHDQLKANLRGFNGTNTAKAVDYSLDGFGDPTHVINFTTNHDEQRTIYECVTYAGCDYATAVKYEKMTGAVLLTAAGVPMLYHGQEWGEDLPKVVGKNPIDWSKPSREPWKGILAYYKGLLGLRAQLPALRSRNVKVDRVYGSKRTIVYHRWKDNEYVVVVANFSRQPQEVDVPFPAEGTWYEFTRDDTVQVTGPGIAGYRIAGPEARIFTQRRLWTGVGGAPATNLPSRFELLKPYPNPFNGVTTLTLRVPQHGHLRLLVFNSLGQRVASVWDGPADAGTHRFRWDPGSLGLTSGVYVLRARFGSQVLTTKLVYLR